MKPGSLVMCIDDRFEKKPVSAYVPLPKKGELYTVDEIVQKTKGTGLYLVEIQHLITVEYPGGRIIQERCPFNAARFVEVQPPMDLSFVEELQKEVSL